MQNPPCSGHVALFEPFRLFNETDSQRSERLEDARAVCERCPLLDKAECLLIARNGTLTRGVHGGKIITESNKEKEKINVRIR